MARRSAALILFVVLLFGAQPAGAASPLDVSGRVTDQVRVLGADTGRVQEAMSALEARSGVRLFVVLVSTFDVKDADTWADATAKASHLGGSDMLLAMVPTDGSYQYQWWVGDEVPIADDAVQQIFGNEVEPRLDAADWSGAIVALTDGLQSPPATAEATPDNYDLWGFDRTTVVIALLVLALFVAHRLSYRRGPAGSAHSRLAALPVERLRAGAPRPGRAPSPGK